MYHDLGVTVTLLEYLPAIVPLEDREVSKELERSFTRRGIKVMTNARFDAASVIADDDGVRLTVGPEGKEADRDLRGDAARRHRAGHQRRGRRPRDDDGRGRSRHRQGGRPHADEGAAPLRDRRHRRRAVARPHGRARGDHRGPHDRGRPRRPRHGLRQAAAGDVLPARDRLDRPDRAAVRGARPARRRSARSRSRRSPRRSSAASTRASPRSSPTRRRTRRSASTSSARTRRTSSPRRSLGARRSRRRRGRSAPRPTRTRRSRRSSARPPWPSTGGRSTSRPVEPADRSTGTADDPSGGRDDGHGRSGDAAASPSPPRSG